MTGELPLCLCINCKSRQMQIYKQERRLCRNMWEEIIRSYTENPRDVKSRPLTKQIPLWFHVYVEDGKLYVDRAKENQPSSNLSPRRKRSSNARKCDIMFDIYRRRKCGEPVSAEATATSVNQIYWYGVFADTGY